jgi:hypothetical protein
MGESCCACVALPLSALALGTLVTWLSLVLLLLLSSAAQGIYDPTHGRWYQHDPLGVRPDAPKGLKTPGQPNRPLVALADQVVKGLSLFGHVVAGRQPLGGLVAEFLDHGGRGVGLDWIRIEDVTGK